MTPQEKLMFSLHARKSAFIRKVDRTRSFVANVINDYPSPFGIAFSGGKDSDVVRHLVRSIYPDSRAHFGHEEWIFPETEERIKNVRDLRIFASRSSHETDFFNSWENTDTIPGNIEVVSSINDQLGYKTIFIGLRKSESRYRKLHLNSRGLIYFCNKHQMFECNPIADWSDQDVWAYIVTNNIPYNKAYNKLAEIGLKLEERRIGPIVEGKALQRCMYVLKQGWPELCHKFILKYPEAQRYL